jgi:DNA-binding XRE family transcriptional regulator
MSFPFKQMRAARHRKGMTMKQLGKMLDPPVRERTVHMWETGQYAPKSPRREQIIHLLEMHDATPEPAAPPPVLVSGTINMPRAELIESLLRIRSEVDGLLGRL